jgi:hypothetical protein
MTRAFRQYPICRGQLDQSGSGSSRVPTRARATLQLAVHELQYVLQHIVIDKIIVSKKLVLVISLHFSVALAQNTTGVTTATTMAAAARNGPQAPHMRLCAPRQRLEWMGDNPLSLWMYFMGGLRVFIALKALLCSGNDASPQHWSIYGPYTPSTAAKVTSASLGGCRPSIQRSCVERKASCGALGGHFCRRWPWLAMDVLVDVGRWRLTSDRSTVGIVEIVYGSIIFYSYVDLTYS